MCVSIFMFVFILFCFLRCRERGKKPYCCKDYNLDWDLNVFISAWCIYEPLQTLSVFSPQRVHRCTSGGAIFHGAPPLIAVAASSTYSSGLCLSKVGWGQRGYCYHHARPLKGVHKVCWLTIIPSLFFFFFYPHEVETASHWWTMLLLLWTIKTEKIRAELPCQATCVPVLVFVCVCVCVRVGLSSSIQFRPLHLQGYTIMLLLRVTKFQDTRYFCKIPRRIW